MSLTPEQIASVAREVTGEQSWQVDSFGVVCTAWQQRWDPDFSINRADWIISREQALAIVEWLADHAMQGNRNFDIRIMDLIRDKDTTSLMQMVLEIRHES